TTLAPAVLAREFNSPRGSRGSALDLGRMTPTRMARSCLTERWERLSSDKGWFLREGYRHYMNGEVRIQNSEVRIQKKEWPQISQIRGIFADWMEGKMPGDFLATDGARMDTEREGVRSENAEFRSQKTEERAAAE